MTEMMTVSRYSIAARVQNATRRPRGAHKWKAVLTFLAKQGDNGIVWNILSYWRATN